jgi:hypothetical protein
MSPQSTSGLVKLASEGKVVLSAAYGIGHH